MNFTKQIGLKQLLSIPIIALVFASFVNKIVHQPGFVKKAVCEQGSLSDEEESYEDFQLILPDFHLPQPVFQVLLKNQDVTNVPVLKDHRFESWPAIWLCYHQMKIGFMS